MFELFVEISKTLERAFLKIERQVPSPVLVAHGSYCVFRYREKTVQAAIVQKCARLISGLNASLVLLENGYVQELGALFRMLQESNEDILFLCQAIRNDDTTKTKLHDDYLADFYQEEFDIPNNPFLSTQMRRTIKRDKIHAAISRIPEQEINQSDSQELHRTFSQAYSGFVHGASGHIMDMYGGNPPRFHVSGMIGTPKISEFTENTFDYFYNSLIIIMMVALYFKQDNLFKELYEFRCYIEQKSGNTNWENPETLVKNEKKKI